MHRIVWSRVSVLASASLLSSSLLSSCSLTSSASCESLVSPAPALDANNFKPFPLVNVSRISHDTKLYTFGLPTATSSPGIEPAACLLVKVPGADGKPVIRPYTPVSPTSRRGSFDLLVKTYPAGNASKYLDGLAVGDTLEMKGPISKFAYTPNQWKAIGMIAGGTGITPMFQLIQEILSNPRDRTEIRLVYANRTPGDILLHAQLEALAAVHPQFKVLYTVDALPEGEAGAWKGRTGHVDASMITSFLPPPKQAAGPTRVLVCGPPGLMKHLSGEKKSPSDQGELTGLLAQLHYTKEDVYKY